MYHQDVGAVMGQANTVGHGAALGAHRMSETQACEPKRERVLLDDIQALSQAIDRLDDELSLVASRIQPLLRSRGKDPFQAPECATPHPTSDVSAALLEAVRRLELMTSRSVFLRHDIAL